MNLNQITIKSTDVSLAVKFYLKLGLKLIVDSTPRYARLECPVCGSTFSISQGDVSVEQTTVIYFEVEDIDQKYQQLKQQGLEFNCPPKDKDWLWREANLNDPDGNPLKLFAAGKNRKNPPWRIPTKRWFECISDSPYNLMK